MGKMMFRFFCVLSFTISLIYSQWQMFSDTKDTYLYNTQTGEIYIRHHQKGNQNYQDVFVKMPRGMTPQELINQNQTPTIKEINKKDGVSDPKATTKTSNTQTNQAKSPNDPLLDSKLESLKKSQEMMNEALKGAF